MPSDKRLNKGRINMLIKNATREQLDKALEQTNKEYDGNVIYNEITSINQKGTRHRMTLRVKEAHGKGARLGFYQNPNTGNRRHLISACWHVHGTFFDNLLNIAPEAEIKAGTLTIYKTINGVFNNWQDRNIGSQMNPFYFSEACEC
jgi:hypothetical protein